MPKAAAIDIGSNAIRLVVGGRDDQGKLQIYRKMREPVRLGKDVFEKERRISIDSITLALKAFEKFKKVISEQKITQVRAVATSAVREASNGPEFIEILDKAHGIKVEVVDGIEEARLIKAAIDEELNLSDKRATLLDIGGGSVEVTLLMRGKVRYMESFKLGTVRLLKKMESDKLSTSEIEQYVHEGLAPLKKKLQENRKAGEIDVCVGTGGNVECLGAIRANFLNKNSMTKLYLEELEKIIKKLDQMTYKERVEKWNLRPDRADVILPASLVIRTIMQIIEAETLLIPRVGLKDGLLLSLLPKPKS